MDVLTPTINQYAESLTTAEGDILKTLHRQTHLKVLYPHMVSGHLQGALLSLFSRMVQPTHILEIGTFTGYSAICLCEGLQEGGVLHTIDINEELEDIQSQFFEKAGVQDRIVQHIGNALDIIPTIDEQFDIVFLDADKVNYPNYYRLVMDKLKVGGLLIADNVLWGGKVLEPIVDEDTQAIVDFSKLVHEDERMYNVLLPIRDGIMIAQKISE